MLLGKIGEALMLAGGMAWQVGWSLILGFVLSGAVQALVSKERMQRTLGRDGIREIALATGFGAASSSCSYAAAAMSKTLFKKGAALVPSMAFLFSSTNLVLELGIILWLLMGWQFTAAEWIGGLVLIAIMTVLVKLTYPKQLVEEARRRVDQTGGHDHGSAEAERGPVIERLRNPATRVAIAQNFAMDFSMLWKDLLGGFLIAGALAAFVPDHAWKALFLNGAAPGVQLVGNVIVGPIIAILSFVCSIGNVPLAAVLWASGISFGGVLAFLYADLIVLPLLDVYRKYYGVRMMLYIFAVFFTTMVLAAIVMDGAFSALHLVPKPNPNIRHDLTMFSFNYTFVLNVAFGAVAVYLWWLNRSAPMDHSCHGESSGPDDAHHDDHAHIVSAGR
ncbi:MAG: permease [Candidatus Eremiobacteraeota bacterium]|nr:permease [Candidatus Eremiobacteraeota bacterium]